VIVARDSYCDECMGVACGMQDTLLADRFIKLEKDIILNEVCPDSGLRDRKCKKFTDDHWEDLAGVLFSFLIVPTSFCTDNVRGDCTNCTCSDAGTTDCVLCTVLTNRIGGYIGGLIGTDLDETVEFMTSEFCVSGVAEKDRLFCEKYAKKVLPVALPIFSKRIMDSKENICKTFLNFC